MFWVLCIGMVYLPEWLRQTGLDTAQIGLVLASATWLKIPVTLLAGNMADRLGRRKKVLLVIALLLAVLVPLLLVVRGYLWLCLLWACVGALSSTMVPITDSISVTAVRRDGLIYGRMRMWGSLGFLVASVFGGMVIRWSGTDSVVWLLFFGALALLFFVLNAPDYETRRPLQKDLVLLPVLQLPGFVIFLMTAAVLMASHAALYSISTVRWVDAGLELPVIGLLWATGVVAEIFMFFISARLIARWSPWQLLLIAGVVGCLRWSLTALILDVVLLFFIQSMHAITFTFTQLAVVSFIERKVPEEMTSSAQTIYDSCALGMVFGAALYVSGLLSQVDMALSFWAMAVMSGSGGVMALCMVGRRYSEHKTGTDNTQA